MARLFGTDGVRGLANKDVTADLALRLGGAAARELATEVKGRRPRAVVGRDPRASGEFLGSAVAAGLASSGVDVIDLEVLPTPGLAFLVSELDADLGVMISASHNPMPDNGIKFFQAGGYKLDDAIEDRVEARLDEEWERPTGIDVGRIRTDPGAAIERYIAHLISAIGTTLENKPLQGLRIAVDAANGAASVTGPAALRRAGADVVVMNASPDGRNINKKAGSTHPEQLQAVVKAADCDFGVAFDGDADRCLAVDHNGEIVDGDQILGILAKSMKNGDSLPNDTLVVTIMSNLGLLNAMAAADINTVQTGVGDRYVLEEMRAHGHGLGGEQSGHIIFSEFATTGDGVLTALKLANEVRSSGKKLSELAADIPRLPQTLVNVSGVDRNAVATNEIVQKAISGAEALLGATGRVLLRASGTEPLIRVMVEAATQEQADGVAASLAQVVRENLSL
ncbi:MAG: phosphoglucosamine mutase [Cellulomonadaceae bacterium]|jgi:phosphoglucosamine mutase|nr:phosphoglucosamine mutase [Cellulomonadaceae bacterium]